MNRGYCAKYVTAEALESGEAWRAAAVGRIDDYPWDVTGYRPETAFQAVWTAEGLALRYETVERELQITRRGLHPRVCDDSAVELFVMPAPARDGRYVNLECNPLGAMYVGVGTGREDNVLLRTEPLAQFRAEARIAPVTEGYRWTQRFFVPFDFLRRHTALETPGRGTRMRANFYKLAEAGPYPHCGCWNHIEWPVDDFHRPEFFGELLLD